MMKAAQGGPGGAGPGPHGHPPGLGGPGGSPTNNHIMHGQFFLLILKFYRLMFSLYIYKR